jgi:hypothetical protein
MQIYCPRCGNAAPQSQRFCRTCGMDLRVILEASEGRRGPIDFETLKADLRELGTNLRAGFEQARQSFKETARLQNATPSAPAETTALPPEVVKNLNRTIRALRRKLNRLKLASSRKYSLQRATLSIFSGTALMIALNYLLDGALNSGLLGSLERWFLKETQAPIYGLAQLARTLWVLGLIPVAKGVAHLINGIFFAPKLEDLEDETADAIPAFVPAAPAAYVSPFAPEASQVANPASTTSDLQRKAEAQELQPTSVTEDATLRFAAREAAGETK